MKHQRAVLFSQLIEQRGRVRSNDDSIGRHQKNPCAFCEYDTNRFLVCW